MTAIYEVRLRARSRTSYIAKYMIEIIYQDHDIIVVNKPPRMSVHGGLNVSGPTLVDFLLKKFPEIRGVKDTSTGADEHGVLRPGIVHRLDKDTSGVMVIARNQKSFEALKDAFKNRRVEKTYWAIVCGILKKKQGTINFPIGRIASCPLKRGVSAGRIRIRGAREAITEYRALKEGSGVSLVELKPKTGRMHQLRVHMNAIGHPVACDTVYGGKNVCCPAFVPSDETTAGKPSGAGRSAENETHPNGRPAEGEARFAGRQLLHAKSLSFSLASGKKFSFEADPPRDFMDIVNRAFP